MTVKSRNRVFVWVCGRFANLFHANTAKQLLDLIRGMKLCVDQAGFERLVEYETALTEQPETRFNEIRQALYRMGTDLARDGKPDFKAFDLVVFEPEEDGDGTVSMV